VAISCGRGAANNMAAPDLERTEHCILHKADEIGKDKHGVLEYMQHQNMVKYA